MCVLADVLGTSLSTEAHAIFHRTEPLEKAHDCYHRLYTYMRCRSAGRSAGAGSPARRARVPISSCMRVQRVLGRFAFGNVTGDDDVVRDYDLRMPAYKFWYGLVTDPYMYARVRCY